MSVIQQLNPASLTDAWRTINVDALDPESSTNFDTTTLHTAQPDITEDEVHQLHSQVRQLLRGGDAEGALRGCLEQPVYQGSDQAKEAHLQTILEVLQSIKASEMGPLLRRIYESDGGCELLDILMKYLYKGMEVGSSGGQSAASSRVPSRTPTPGFSQVGGRSGMSNEPTSSSMSVILSWHEKLVEVVGSGSIVRCMADFRRV